jgi:nucleotide-binding universal stress UspA family protein
MYTKILVPMALDHGVAGRSVEIARALLANGGDIIALHVYEAPQGSVSAYLDEEVVKAAYTTVKAKLEARAAELGGLTPVLLKGHTSRTIVDYAHQNAVDCIVIGSHKPGLSDFLLGSTAARVARHAHCAVHIIRSN